MKHNLTKIASLPGSGGGCMSSLPAEKNEPRDGWDGIKDDSEEVPLPKIDTVDEMATKMLAAVQGGQ